jgi:hypothetical protein
VGTRNAAALGLATDVALLVVPSVAEARGSAATDGTISAAEPVFMIPWHSRRTGWTAQG